MFQGSLLPFFQDLRGALRSLIKHPTVSGLAILSLALAIAGNAVVFSMVSSWLMHSWSYKDPDTLAFVWQSKEGEFLGQTPPTPANFVDWKDRSLSLEEWTAFRPTSLTLTGGDTPEAVVAGEVSANIFPLLGIQPILGQAFGPENEIRGRHRTVVLEHEFWTQHFGADPDIVGSTLELGGSAYTVLGILPATFEFIFAPVKMLVPIVLDDENLSRSRKELLTMARLKPEVTLEEAESEMQTIMAALAQEYPEENRDYSAKVLSLPQQFPGEINQKLFVVLQGLLVMVLLIACINVANLLLARGQQRRKELALRAALGAGKARIFRQLLTESLMLSLFGGLLGLLLGWAGMRSLFSAFATQLPKSFTPTMDLRVVLFTAGIAVLSGAIFGLVPALQASTPHLGQALSEGGRGGAGGKRRRWLTRGLVVVEITGALVMLCGAGLLVRSFLDIQNADPGFETKGLLTYQLSLPEDRYGEDRQVADFYHRLVRKMEALPGATKATVTNFLPRTPLPASLAFYLEGEPTQEPSQHSATAVTIGPGYLETLEVPLLRGRPLIERDHAEALPVTLINHSMAQRFWPDSDPLGQRITVGDQTREIVGITGNIQQDLLLGTSSGFAPIFYLPQGQSPSRAMAVMIRSQAPPKTLLPEVRLTLLKMDPDLSAARPLTMEEYTEKFFLGMILINKLLIAAGLVALILAAVGIYGVIAFSVSQRTREIGIRMALGARRSDVLRQITWEGVLLALVGFALGLPVVGLLILGIESLLKGFGTVSPSSAGIVAVLLFLVAVAASIIPARRAASLDPVRALMRD